MFSLHGWRAMEPFKQMPLGFSISWKLNQTLPHGQSDLLCCRENSVFLHSDEIRVVVELLKYLVGFVKSRLTITIAQIILTNI